MDMSLKRIKTIAFILLVNHLVWVLVWQIDPEPFTAYIGFPELYNKIWVFGYISTAMMWLYLEERINGKVQVEIERKPKGL